jgi:hypothetical protein
MIEVSFAPLPGERGRNRRGARSEPQDAVAKGIRGHLLRLVFEGPTRVLPAKLAKFLWGWDRRCIVNEGPGCCDGAFRVVGGHRSGGVSSEVPRTSQLIQELGIRDWRTPAEEGVEAKKVDNST